MDREQLYDRSFEGVFCTGYWSIFGILSSSCHFNHCKIMILWLHDSKKEEDAPFTY